jgi:hypothetical protein
MNMSHVARITIGTCNLSVLAHFRTLNEMLGILSGVAHVLSQHDTGCINWRRAASVEAALTPMRRRVAI